MKNQTAALLVTCFTQPRIPNNNRRVLKNQITCRENGIKFAFILYRIYYWRWYYRGRWFPDVTNYESFVISDSNKNLAYRCYHNYDIYHTFLCQNFSSGKSEWGKKNRTKIEDLRKVVKRFLRFSVSNFKRNVINLLTLDLNDILDFFF